MALPPLSIKITADSSNATAGLEEVKSATKAVDIATEQYAASLRQIASAQKSGLITQKAAASAIMQAEAAYENAAQAAVALTGAQVTMVRQAKVAGTAMRSAGGHTANLAAQFNDIGVMLAAGQSPLMLAMQQGTQINQVFAQMGGGTQALRGLGAAAMSLINPMSLATIGIIAGGAALVQWGMAALGAGEEGKKFAEILKDIDERAREAGLSLRAMEVDISAEQLAVVTEIQKQIDDLTLQRIDALVEVERLEGAIAKILAGGISDSSLLVQNAQSELLLAQQRVMANDQNLASLSAQLQAEREKLATIERAENVSRLYKQGLSLATIAAMELAGVDIAENISRATVEAALLAQNLNISLEAARQIKFEQATQNRYSGRGGDPRQFDTEGRLGGAFVPGADIVTQADNILNPQSGGRSKVDPRERQLSALIDSLQTEREVVQEWYQESLDLLNSATDAELAALGGKHAAIQRLEAEHQERMKGLAQGGLAGALQAYQKYGSQILGAMGATGEQMALINAAIGASQALADPTIPFWGKFAAVAQVLAAGRSLASQASTGAAGGGSAAAAPTAQTITRNVNVNLQGGTASAQSSIRDLIAQINDAIGDGATLNVRGMA